MLKDFSYGGQAVFEGVMMRGKNSYAVAVRRPDGEISVKEERIKTLSSKFNWPLGRGLAAIGEALTLGIKILSYSLNEAGEEEEEELTSKDIFWAVFLAVIGAIGLFIILPRGLVYFFEDNFSYFWQNLLEGFLRLLVLLVYVFAISRMAEIKRLFSYHGAEHKVINAYEAKEELVPEKVAKYSRVHPRCGTSFLFLAVLLTIFVYSFLNIENIFWNMASRILVIPIIIGLGYEILKFSSRHYDAWWMKPIILPGLWLQEKFTTAEPDLDQLEVAIKALEAVLEEDEQKGGMFDVGEAAPDGGAL